MTVNSVSSSSASSHHCSSIPSRQCTSTFSLSGNDNIFEKKVLVKKTNIEIEDLMDDADNQQWVLDMVNIPAVWSQGIFGTGVRIRVNDDGVDQNNPHWGDRFDKDASCAPNQTPSSSSKQHGTSVASIIGASNSEDNTCTVGIAPGVILSACYGLAPDESFLSEKVDQMDISSNSFERPACQPDDERRRDLQADQCPFAYSDYRPQYDPCLVCDSFSNNAGYNDNTIRSSTECVEAIVEHCNRYYEIEREPCSEFLDLIIGGECDYVGLSNVARNSIVKGVNEGRDGKGIIYVFAAGNSHFEGDDTNLKGYTSSRLTISVGAVGADGLHAYYSTAGASVLISGPGGDVDDNKRHFTAKVGGGCTEASVGTSFSTPVVSAIVAMMLEVNPNLGWRDVQGILVLSATAVPNDPLDDTDTVNGASLWHSNFYGFGIVDAEKAVELSRTWINYSDEKLIAADSGDVNAPIYDDASSETISSITIAQDVPTSSVGRQTTSDSFIVEAVEVLLDISHFSRGDLSVVLTSPSGTESVLHPGSLPENNQLGEDQAWKLLTVRNWGESPYGQWTLKLVDEKAGSFGECVDVEGYSFTYADNSIVDCGIAERIEICKDGDYNEDFFNRGNFDSLKARTDDEDRTLQDACCTCGGGVGQDGAPEDALNHWTIAIYGRQDGATSKDATLAPNPQPTASPTKSPVASPTDAPAIPTDAPVDPTGAPVTPTDDPVAPTDAPVAPTDAPVTPSPTAAPTASPTKNPTPAPTASPTKTPTKSPTAAPTSPSPSGSPSSRPSMFPTVMPSFQPSPFPSSAPTQQITIPPPPAPISNAPIEQPTGGSSFTPPPVSSPSSAPLPSASPAPSSAPSTVDDLDNPDGSGNQGAGFSGDGGAGGAGSGSEPDENNDSDTGGGGSNGGTPPSGSTSQVDNVAFEFESQQSGSSAKNASSDGARGISSAFFGSAPLVLWIATSTLL
ncbi:MAG: hypothetical protein SGILL_000913 [Bacillariaceae sp.]